MFIFRIKYNILILQLLHSWVISINFAFFFHLGIGLLQLSKDSELQTVSNICLEIKLFTTNNKYTMTIYVDSGDD